MGTRDKKWRLEPELYCIRDEISLSRPVVKEENDVT